MKKSAFLVLFALLFVESNAQSQKPYRLKNRLKELISESSTNSSRPAALKNCTKDTTIMQQWISSQNAWQNANKTQHFYDSKDQLAYELVWTWNWNSGYWTSDYNITYNYNSAGKLTSFLRQHSKSPFQQLLATYSYNAAQQETLYLEQFWDSGTNTWKNSSQTIYTYDGAQNNTVYLKQTWDNSTNNWRDYSKTLYTYSNNKVSSMVRMIYNSGGPLVNNYKVTYTYDASQNITGATTYSWDLGNNTWVTYEKITVTYNGHKDITSVLYMFWDNTANNWLNTEKTTITYNAAYSKTSELYQEWNASTSSWKNSNQTFWTYDFTNQVTSENYQYWDAAANMWITSDFTSYVYDSNGNEVYREYKSRTGSSDPLKNTINTTTIYNCTTVGLSETGTDVETFSLYPNPSSDILYINSENSVSTIKVMDIAGRSLAVEKGNELNVSNLHPGIYLIQVLNEKAEIIGTKKFVKE